MSIIRLTHARPTKYFLQLIERPHFPFDCVLSKSKYPQPERVIEVAKKYESNYILKIKITLKLLSKYGHAKRFLFFYLTKTIQNFDVFQTLVSPRSTKLSKHFTAGIFHVRNCLFIFKIQIQYYDIFDSQIFFKIFPKQCSGVQLTEK